MERRLALLSEASEVTPGSGVAKKEAKDVDEGDREGGMREQAGEYALMTT